MKRTPLVLMLLACYGIVSPGIAGDPSFAKVPPALEIEVLDPGVDPNGNPAVLLQSSADGELAVEIPPTVLVHRYYFSGERSFQGPMLPGGPSILVVNHPKSGERVYIPVQMMPGAPRVIYSKDSIEYDYGEHAVVLHFGFFGKPTVKYRHGRSWTEKVAHATHAEAIKTSTAKMVASSKNASRRLHTSMVGMKADAAEKVEQAFMPVQTLVTSLPFGQQLFGRDLEKYYAEKATAHAEKHQARRAENAARVNDSWRATNR